MPAGGTKWSVDVNPREALIQAVREAAQQGDWDEVLRLAMVHFEAGVSTLHRHRRPDDLLELVAQSGLPEVLLPTVGAIPVGKGMAGLAAARREPVQVCNLQTDESGQAKPGAKLTRMEGSIALPILVEDELLGTFGVGKPVPHQYTPDEVALLEEIATVIGQRLRNERSPS
ncbi:MAG: GAF domain-containing protein [Planctomycetes bacterium]|nr:GAF domain-containing protein [Planctomycetota bacterium]